jgi:hypothetical protein
MNYAQSNRISADKESVKLLNRLLKYHVDKTKNNLLRVANFSSEANHLLYKRYKHAGIPILANSLQTSPKSGPMKDFEVFNIVSEGLDPFRDIIILPYSKGVLGRYEKLVGILQNILREMVINRRACIERGVDGIIPLEYPTEMFSSEERSLVQTLVNEFYNTHPTQDLPKRIDYNLDKEATQKMLQKIKWYLHEDL